MLQFRPTVDNARCLQNKPVPRSYNLERRPYTIAVVEDDASMSKSIQRLLSAYGLNVETYPSAEAFLDRDPNNRIACVVLDIDLPGMSGLELRQRLKAISVDLPVVFVTGVDDDAVEKSAIQLGCVAYLRKPFAPQSLFAAITEALGRSIP